MVGSRWRDMWWGIGSRSGRWRTGGRMWGCCRPGCGRRWGEVAVFLVAGGPGGGVFVPSVGFVGAGGVGGAAGGGVGDWVAAGVRLPGPGAGGVVGGVGGGWGAAGCGAGG